MLHINVEEMAEGQWRWRVKDDQQRTVAKGVRMFPSAKLAREDAEKLKNAEWR